MRWGLLLLLIAVSGSAQNPRFETRTDEVLVPVSVTTKSGKPVENLAAQDFVVTDDGTPQRVRLFASSDAMPLPIDAVIVLETDAGREAAWAKIKKTASLVSSYITNDMGTGTPSVAAVVTVADQIHVAQNFTNDPDTLGDTFAKIDDDGNGNAIRLIDGVNLACDLLASRKENARRLIVLISESRDLRSKAHFADVVAKAQKESIVIYTISYSAFTTAFTEKASDRPPPPDEPGLYNPDDKGGMNLLAIPMLLAQLSHGNISEAFAQGTGGSHGKFTTLRGLETQLITVGNEVHNRYTLTFTPRQKQSAGYHKLMVSVKTAKSEAWQVHARPGYWATSP
jgi:VWFA-related protein